MVNRYSIDVGLHNAGQIFCDMVKKENGDFVSYEAYSRLKKKQQNLEDAIKSANSKITELKEINMKYKRGLRFYAQESNWEYDHMMKKPDGGKVAREALDESDSD